MADSASNGRTARDVVALLKAATLEELDGLVERYADDPRAQVRKAVEQVQRRAQKEQAEGDRVLSMYALEDEMSESWLALAKTGDPNHAGIPVWPPCTETSVPCMCFDRKTELRTDHDKALLAIFPDILGFFPPGPSKMYVATGYPPAE